MLSLFENCNTSPTPSICIRILHDNTLTQDNRDKLIQIAERYGQQLKFYNVEELCIDRIAEIRRYIPNPGDNRKIGDNRFTIGTYYRFFIPFVLPTEINKVIYLDGDVIITLDINEFWQVDLGDSPLGVVTSGLKSLRGIVKDTDYFNAGVLLMNLKILRDEYKVVQAGMKFLAENPQLFRWGDQDLLNYCFAVRAMKLPDKFNFRVCSMARPRNESPGKKFTITWASTSRCITSKTSSASYG
ncbi:MAG: hypothetical protein II968_05285 [Selenomonadaceae bacterium]|nr:hypothetical protein [Selenomonadaceae bacterium]